LPAGAGRIGQALRSLRGAAVLDGARGRPAVDLDGAARLAARLGELLLERSLTLIELNPVIVWASGAVAVDAAVCAARAAASVAVTAADLTATCMM
jgi:acetate---CoA ligase (ADP-forming)